MIEGFRYLLRRNDIVFHYPNSSRRYKVNFDLEWKYIETGYFEEAECVTRLQKIVKPGDTIIDVGANVGRYTLLFSEMVGSNGKVIGFEPDPMNFQVLRENMELNKITNAKLEEEYVTDGKGTVILSNELLGSSGSSMLSCNAATQDLIHQVKVDSTSLDEYCQENNILPDGIKVDVEGSEWLVLKGAGQTIKSCKRWILLEFHGNILDPESNQRIQRYFQDEAKKTIFMDGDKVGFKHGDIISSQLPSRSHCRVLVIF